MYIVGWKSRANGVIKKNGITEESVEVCKQYPIS